MPIVRLSPLLIALLAACNTGKIDLSGIDAGDGGSGGDAGATDSGDGGKDGDGGGDGGGDVAVGDLVVSPGSIDFGLTFVGHISEGLIELQNVGTASLTATLEIDGKVIDWYSLDPASATLDAGGSSTHTLALAPTAWGDGAIEVVVTDTSSGESARIPVTATVQVDTDGDGFGSIESGGDDCDDDRSDVNPAAQDTWYDGVDSDCAGNDDYDQDLDGAQVDVDCDDTDSSVFPGAADTWYDGIDSDCAGNDDYDQDLDGSAIPADCDDEDPAIYPGAPDAWYDGVDSDCAGNDDDDQDGDGYVLGKDCDDTDATITGPVDESLNGVDDDCDGTTDNLSISDAASGVLYGYSSSMALGNHGNLALIDDLTGDGLADLVVCAEGASNGYLWVVQGAAAASAAGRIDSYDTAIATGTSGYYKPTNLVSPMGDQDGDGVSDLVYGATHSSYDYAYVYLFDGGSGLSGTLSPSSGYQARFEGDSSSDRLAMGALADIDGDGFADLISGASEDHYQSSSSYTYSNGNVSVFEGGGLSETYDLEDADDEIHGQSGYDDLGTSLTTGDLDGDGYIDIIAGAPGEDDAGDSAGAVYVFRGNSSLSWSSQADGAASIKFVGASSGDDLGEDMIPTPGDVDGDGALDLLLPSEDEGSGWLYLAAGGMSSSVKAAAADHTFTGTDYDFMTSAVINSDLDGDGMDEVAVGGDGTDESGTDSGVVWIFNYASGWGSSLTDSSAVATIWGAATEDYLGAGMAGGEDLDGDGRDDLVVGAVGVDTVSSGGGAAYIILGW